ncbi:MAG TPA: DUF421 domain-containing protein [Ruminiclostridium sp.]|nr:DUF421 domain-containing protein [Ruminiclostridium sp.]
MLSKIIEIILRSIAAYVILLILSRLMGRKILSQITFFDFIVGVALGSLAVRISLGSADSVWLGIISAVVITLLVLLTEWLNLTNLRFLRVSEGIPITVICNGEIIDENLKKLRLSLSKLLEMLREKDYYNVGDIAFAVVESDGKLSIIPKSSKRPVTLNDIGKNEQEPKLPVDLIIDGKLLSDNLTEAGLDEQWLISQLSPYNLKVDNIFYAGLTTNGELYISPRNGHT